MEKSILVLTDFVGSGDVAMAAARAVLTRLGHRVICLPTALISNTWNLGTVAQMDTTDYMKAALETWQRLGLPLDGVLLGYVADDRQAQWLGERCREWHRAGVTIFLDPIFADNGQLYRGITQERVELLRTLLPRVDYVLPNRTEAAFLTGAEEPMEALHRLTALGAGTALITGASWEGTAAVLLAQGSRTQALPYSPIPGQFPGAGDVFTALFAGHILAGKDPAASAQAAMDTTALWISQSLCSPHAAIGLPVERYF